MLWDFTKGSAPTGNISIRNGYSNGNSFVPTWSTHNAVYSNNELCAEITYGSYADGKSGASSSTYYGVEMRSTDFKKYGYFGARMKPSNAPGTVSSLFTYTGSSDGNAHNEIDIEFLGKDTSKAQFNIYCNSDEANKRAYLYSLGFDASKEYHDYGFYWGEDRITWYVDGIAVYSNSDSKLGIPATAQRVFLNHWNVASSLYSWAGTWSDANLPSKDYYKWVSYKAL